MPKWGYLLISHAYIIFSAMVIIYADNFFWTRDAPERFSEAFFLSRKLWLALGDSWVLDFISEIILYNFHGAYTLIHFNKLTHRIPHLTMLFCFW